VPIEPKKSLNSQLIWKIPNTINTVDAQIRNRFATNVVEIVAREINLATGEIGCINQWTKATDGWQIDNK